MLEWYGTHDTVKYVLRCLMDHLSHFPLSTHIWIDAICHKDFYEWGTDDINVVLLHGQVFSCFSYFFDKLQQKWISRVLCNGTTHTHMISFLLIGSCRLYTCMCAIFRRPFSVTSNHASFVHVEICLWTLWYILSYLV